MEMSPISPDTQHVQVKRINLHKVPHPGNDDHSVILPQLRPINSMHSTVTPEFVNAFKTNAKNVSTAEQLFPTRRSHRIAITVGVIVAVLMAIIAIIVVVKYRG